MRGTGMSLDPPNVSFDIPKVETSWCLIGGYERCWLTEGLRFVTSSMGPDDAEVEDRPGFTSPPGGVHRTPGRCGTCPARYGSGAHLRERRFTGTRKDQNQLSPLQRGEPVTCSTAPEWVTCGRHVGQAKALRMRR